MIDIAELDRKLLNELFDFNVLPAIQLFKRDKFPEKYTKKEEAKIQKLIDEKHTVVGIDIYQYSLFPANKQVFIPPLFESIYVHAWNLIRQNYSFIFQYYQREDTNRDKYINHKEYFISTGDGGYQILETPIHAVLFILTFATIVRFYNSDLFMRKLHAKIGNIELRYAITLDNLYKYRDNFYGAAIINNARILSKDRLDRLLIDKNTHDWFLDRIAGIENLMSLKINNIVEDISEFSGYDRDKIAKGNNALIHSDNDYDGREGIKSIDVQKISKTKQKQTELEIYNLHIQAIICYVNFFKTKEKIVTVSAGNLNVVGI